MFDVVQFIYLVMFMVGYVQLISSCSKFLKFLFFLPLFLTRKIIIKKEPCGWDILCLPLHSQICWSKVTKGNFTIYIVIWKSLIKMTMEDTCVLSLPSCIWSLLLMSFFLFEESWVLQMRIHGPESLLCLILNLPFQSGLQRWLGLRFVAIFPLILLLSNMKI